jgi:hypothetical protein
MFSCPLVPLACRATQLSTSLKFLTLDRDFLTEHAGTLAARLLDAVDAGLRFVLQL